MGFVLNEKKGYESKAQKPSSQNKGGYSHTCNLYQPKFPLKASGDPNSFDSLSYWLNNDLNARVSNLNQGPDSKMFLLHDGPPYANGPLHLGSYDYPHCFISLLLIELGHVMQKVVKDSFLKYKRLQGYYCPFVPGWDCHGMPIGMIFDL
jgi:isoleucyl-tRNA synthetase